MLLLGPAAAATPPFVDLHLQGITTSNDEYGIWLYWSPRGLPFTHNSDLTSRLLLCHP